MEKVNKTNVFKVYDKISTWFDAQRSKDLVMEKAYLDFILQHIPAGGSVLDVGCGTGEPIAKFFIDNGYQLTGVDASGKMIERCKQRFPNGCWLLADMRTLQLTEQFNIVIAWHSFFHLPHEDQKKTLNLLASYVNDDGLFVFTSGPAHSEEWSNNGGHNLYHASFSAVAYKKMLAENNLKVLIHTIKDPNCGGATIWIAQKN